MEGRGGGGMGGGKGRAKFYMGEIGVSILILRSKWTLPKGEEESGEKGGRVGRRKGEGKGERR